MLHKLTQEIVIKTLTLANSLVCLFLCCNFFPASLAPLSEDASVWTVSDESFVPLELDLVPVLPELLPGAAGSW